MMILMSLMMVLQDIQLVQRYGRSLVRKSIKVLLLVMTIKESGTMFSMMMVILNITITRKSGIIYSSIYIKRTKGRR